MGHVARMGEKMHACRVLVGESEGKNHLEDLVIAGRIIIIIIIIIIIYFKEMGIGLLIGIIWLRYRAVAGRFEHC